METYPRIDRFRAIASIPGLWGLVTRTRRQARDAGQGQHVTPPVPSLARKLHIGRNLIPRRELLSEFTRFAASPDYKPGSCKEILADKRLTAYMQFPVARVGRVLGRLRPGCMQPVSKPLSVLFLRHSTDPDGTAWRCHSRVNLPCDSTSMIQRGGADERRLFEARHHSDHPTIR